MIDETQDLVIVHNDYPGEHEASRNCWCHPVLVDPITGERSEDRDVAVN